MSYKLTCPACDCYTSAIFRAYENGGPCPYCGSSLSAASEQYYRQLPDDHSRTMTPCAICEHPQHQGVCGTPVDRPWGMGGCLCGLLDSLIGQFAIDEPLRPYTLEALPTLRSKMWGE